MLRTGNGIDPSASPTLGDLLTNAKKVTVSVLYWYEELSSLLTEIFKLILKRIKIFFIIFIFISDPLGVGGSPQPFGTIIRSCQKHSRNSICLPVIIL
jgi:hypothetical protein